MGIDWTVFLYPKGSRVEARQTRKAEKQTAEDRCRDAVWKREKNLDRATGKPLTRGAVNPDERGEVHHLKGRRVKPEWRTDPRHQVLLSATLHQLSEARGGKLLQIVGTDAVKALTFIRRDAKGKELWRRTTLPGQAQPPP